jgi:hypothetical protein
MQNPFEFQKPETHVPNLPETLRFSIIVIYILTISAMLIKTKLVFEVKVKALIGSNIKIYFIFFFFECK